MTTTTKATTTRTLGTIEAEIETALSNYFAVCDVNVSAQSVAYAAKIEADTASKNCFVAANALLTLRLELDARMVRMDRKARKAR